MSTFSREISCHRMRHDEARGPRDTPADRRRHEAGDAPGIRRASAIPRHPTTTCLRRPARVASGSAPSTATSWSRRRSTASSTRGSAASPSRPPASRSWASPPNTAAVASSVRFSTPSWPRPINRGSVVSALFPTAPRVYRGLGYERITDLIDASVPTSALAGLPRSSTTTRRATVDDLDAIRAVYDAWSQRAERPAHPYEPVDGRHRRRRRPRRVHRHHRLRSTAAARSPATPPGTAARATARTAKIEVARPDRPQCRRLPRPARHASAASPESPRRRRSARRVTTPYDFSCRPRTGRSPSRRPTCCAILQVDAALSLRGYPRAITAELPFSVDGEPHLLSTRCDGAGRCDTGQPQRHPRADPAGPGRALRRRPVVRQPAQHEPAHRRRPRR